MFATKKKQQSQYEKDLGYYHLVLFLSSWSTGKTLCKREKAKRCAADNQEVIFCVANYGCGEKTLLEMEIEREFTNNIKVTSINLESSSSNLVVYLISLVQPVILSVSLYIRNRDSHTESGRIIVDEYCRISR